MDNKQGKKPLRISVIGAGYVGLTTAVGLASKGYSVICIDTDNDKVNLIKQGKCPIKEEGMEEKLLYCLSNNENFEVTSDYQSILDTDITLICVGTPSNPDGSIDLSYIEEAVMAMGKLLSRKKGYHAVVTRSTIVPGTTKQIIIPLLEKYSGKKAGEDFGIAFNPEFMQEGKALQAFFNPDRVIIGEYDTKAADMLIEINRDCGAPVFRTDITTAEMVKYASNAFLATKISFINEIGNICQQLGIDVYAVAKGISYDYRIGDRFLNAGVGFGGSCLPKDLQALIAKSRERGYQPVLLQSVLDLNNNQARKIVEMAEKKLRNLRNRTIAILGLAFKPNTEDIRNAPAIVVINMLLKKGAKITAHDPMAMPNARQVLPQEVSLADSASKAMEGSDLVLILTEWDEYRNESLYRSKKVIDGRRALDPEKARALCDYQGICW